MERAVWIQTDDEGNLIEVTSIIRDGATVAVKIDNHFYEGWGVVNEEV